MQRNVPTLALFIIVACFMAKEASAQVVRQEVEGIRNFAKIESTVACAGAITPAAIAEIKKMGYASIINLRLATEQGADCGRWQGRRYVAHETHDRRWLGHEQGDGRSDAARPHQ